MKHKTGPFSKAFFFQKQNLVSKLLSSFFTESKVVSFYGNTKF